MKKGTIWTTIIVVAIVLFAFWVITGDDGKVSEELAKCIGENSKYYGRKGCTFCEEQQRMFGTSFKFLTTFDCLYDGPECAEAEITRTPTWIIDGEKYEGVQSIERLKELTGCEDVE